MILCRIRPAIGSALAARRRRFPCIFFAVRSALRRPCRVLVQNLQHHRVHDQHILHDHPLELQHHVPQRAARDQQRGECFRHEVIPEKRRIGSHNICTQRTDFIHPHRLRFLKFTTQLLCHRIERIQQSLIAPFLPVVLRDIEEQRILLLDRRLHILWHRKNHLRQLLNIVLFQALTRIQRLSFLFLIKEIQNHEQTALQIDFVRNRRILEPVHHDVSDLKQLVFSFQ